ncbi:Glycogen debranching enzyme [Minicystis rosea]|nr:Glycogen debranching enzyme [Minicystis rosea]
MSKKESRAAAPAVGAAANGGALRLCDDTLTKKTPAIGRGVATALVIKDGDVYLVTKPDGTIPLQGPHGFGLYLHDCRFLDGYTVRIDDHAPIVLAASTAPGDKAIVELTNPEMPERGPGLDKHELGIRWDRILDGEAHVLHDILRVKSFAAAPIDVVLALTFQSSFEDLFVVRGLCDLRPGTLSSPRWEGDHLVLRYDGADHVARLADIHCRRPPDEKGSGCARFSLHLEPETEIELSLSISLLESDPREATIPLPPAPLDLAGVERRRRARVAAHHEALTEVRTSHVPLANVVARCLGDLAVLRSRIGEHVHAAAGVPWFVALFGRDSILTALSMLAYNPDIAAETLRLLASYQATADDPSRDAEPGKIIHELRVGELAHIGAIPHSPYYGTVDATPLFLVLLARHADWTGSLELFHELRPCVDAALEWIAHRSRRTGYLEYHSRAGTGRANHGWKDSGDAIVMENGDLARPPIALVEVQGYVYLAKTALATLFERAGDLSRAARLRHEAATSKQRFTRDFWLPDRGFFALARTPDGPARVCSSNPGHALWSGIVGPDEARPTVDALLSPAMWSGWGIRTLAMDERRYNPVAYHRGTVWPHDNAIIVAGLRRYGFDDAACRIFEGIVDASTHFRMSRLPELFAGFPRREYEVPVHYPVACHPQAWAAGSVPFMIERLLGLTPDAFDDRLRIVRPVLPASVSTLELHGLRVGRASADLAFSRRPDGRADVRVLRRDQSLDVQIIEDASEQLDR